MSRVFLAHPHFVPKISDKPFFFLYVAVMFNATDLMPDALARFEGDTFFPSMAGFLFLVLAANIDWMCRFRAKQRRRLPDDETHDPAEAVTLVEPSDSAATDSAQHQRRRRSPQTPPRPTPKTAEELEMARIPPFRNPFGLETLSRYNDGRCCMCCRNGSRRLCRAMVGTVVEVVLVMAGWTFIGIAATHVATKRDMGSTVHMSLVFGGMAAMAALSQLSTLLTVYRNRSFVCVRVLAFFVYSLVYTTFTWLSVSTDYHSEWINSDPYTVLFLYVNGFSSLSLFAVLSLRYQDNDTLYHWTPVARVIHVASWLLLVLTLSQKHRIP